MLSVLGTHSLTGKVTGLRDIPRADQPPMLPLLYYAFRVMAGIGFAFLLLAWWTAIVLRRTRGQLTALLANRRLLWAWVLAIPLPYVAVEAGWIVREVGRQPWVVYGLLRTRDAVSAGVAAPAVAGTILMFVAFYLVLLAAFVIFARKWLRAGPDLQALPPARDALPADAPVPNY
jgi:cytochrome d ubiquinol oxidase subunit I